MGARMLGRGRGTAITCAGEGCPAKSVTGQIRIKDHWAWLEGAGWGRGLDAGTVGRPAQPARKAGINPETGSRVRAQTARPAVEARTRTLNKHLCPPCLKQDHAASKARKRKRLEQRDAARRARAAGRMD